MEILATILFSLNLDSIGLLGQCDISVIIRATNPNVLEKTKTHSFQGFSRYAKDRIIEQYQEECVIENCYICNRDDDTVD